MTDSHKDFLRQGGRLPGQAPAAQVHVGALGKHPGWDDHMEGIGLETETLALFKSVFYVQGIGGQIDSGEWRRPESQRDLIAFDHCFLWTRGDQYLIGRLWASTDGHGRAEYPMILCAHCSGVSLRWGLQVVLPRLETASAECRATAASGTVQEIVARCQLDMRNRLASALAEPSCLLPAERAAFLQRLSLGPEQTGLKRVVHELESNFFAFNPEGAGGKSSGEEAHPQQMRVPRNVEGLWESLAGWTEFFRLRISRSAPLLLVAPMRHPWVDVCAGMPGVREMFALRASSIGLATQAPYQISPETERLTGILSQAFLTGATPVDVGGVAGIVKGTERLPFYSQKKWLILAGVVLLVVAVVLCLILPGKPSQARSTGEGKPVIKIQKLTSNTVQSAARPAVGEAKPEAVAKTLHTQPGTPVAVALEGQDSLGRSLSWAVIRGPSHGTLSGETPRLAYVPEAGFAGTDSFQYAVSTDQSTSAVAVITIEVAPAHPPQIIGIADQAIEAGQRFSPVPVEVNANGSAIEEQSVRAHSGNPLWLPDASLRLDGEGGHRTLTIDPVPADPGEARVEVSAASLDGGTNSIYFTVTATKTAVRLLAIEARSPSLQTVEAGDALAPFFFKVTRGAAPAEGVNWLFESSNPSLIRALDFKAVRTNDLWEIRALSKAREKGTASVEMIAVDAGGLMSTTRVDIVVKPFNNPPALATGWSNNPWLLARGRTATNVVMVKDVETRPEGLRLTGKITPEGQVAFKTTGAGEQRLVMLEAGPAADGPYDLRLELSDGDKTVTNHAALQVTAPWLPVLGDSLARSKEIETGQIATVEIPVTDMGSSPANLHLTARSLNPDVLAASAVSIGYSNGWVLTCKPESTAAGDAAVEIKVVNELDRDAARTILFHIASAMYRSECGLDFVWVKDMPDAGGQTWRGRSGGAWVSKTPVTQQMFYKVMGENPSGSKGERRPVENVSLEQIKRFIEKLGEMDRARLPDGWSYKLPTLNQWTRCSPPDSAVSPGRIKQAETRDVGLGKANSNGLFDTSGNVYVIVTEKNACYFCGRSYYGAFEKPPEPWTRGISPEIGFFLVLTP